jgi:hypothetical protein
MSTVFVVADVHCANHAVLGGEHVAGINRRCQLVLDTMRRAVDKALSLDPTGDFVVAGDLFDTCRPSPQIIARTGEELGRYGAQGGRVHVVMGNHDQASTAPGDHALAPLAEMGIEVHERDHGGWWGNRAVLVCPYRPGRGEEWLPGAVAEAKAQLGPTAPTENVLLVTHLGIRDSDTAPWLRDAHDSIHVDQLADVCAAHGVTHVAAGNWHEAKRWTKRGVEIVQVGTLCPTGWDNGGEQGYGIMLRWTSADLTAVHVPGPRFLDRVPLAPLPDGYSAFSSLKAKPADVAAARKLCAEAQAKGHIAGWRVLPESSTEVKAGAELATRVGGAQRAVEEQVAGMVLPAGVRASELIEVCKRYLAGGG